MTTDGNKTRRSKAGKRHGFVSPLRPLLAGFLAGLLLALGIVGGVIWWRGDVAGWLPAKLERQTSTGTLGYPETSAPGLTETAEAFEAPGAGHEGSGTTGKPAIALVIDDFGNQWDTEAVQGLLHWEIPLTVAVIPGLWASERCALTAREQGKEVILHLPMEPEGDDVPVETRMLRRGMDVAQIRALVDWGVQFAPGAVGVNNHQGSAATADSVAMQGLAQVAAARGWLILDSVTTPHSVMRAMARELGVPALARNVFLDHTDDPEAIRAALHAAMERAKRTGRPVVLIGHPRPATWQVLKQTIQPGDTDIRWLTLSEAIGTAG
jgi:polysaccharide deacetylase 2 family uncharacterized protein YibQ